MPVAERAADADPLRPPWTRQRAIWLVAAAVTLVLVPVSFHQTGVAPAALVDSVDDIRGLLDRMLPADFREGGRYLRAIVETVWMVIAGTALAVVFSVPLAFLAARNTALGGISQRVSRAVIVFARTVPDVIWALLFVRVVGIGPLAGVLAMGLYSTGMIAKFFGDYIEQVDRRPLEAVRAAGGSRLQVFATAVLPQVLSNWVAIVLYRVDTNMRYSVILGYVGAGGIGLELQRVQGQLAYPRVMAIVVLIFVTIMAVEQLSGAVRRSLANEIGPNPFGYLWGLRSSARRAGRTGRAVGAVSVVGAGRAVGAVGAGRVVGVVGAGRTARGGRTAGQDRRARPADLLGDPSASIRQPWTPARRRTWFYGVLAVASIVVSVFALRLDPGRILGNLGEFLDIIRLMVPPDFVTGIDRILEQLLETFWIAVAATALGVAISIPFAILGARNAAPHPVVRTLARLGMLGARGIPDLILAVLFVVAFGLGPFAGVLALAVGAIGFTGKLLADAVEDQPRGPLTGLEATGANWWQRTAAGVWPQAVPSLLSVGLYTLDLNLRNATILGIVGAGGIGATLSNTITFMEYDRAFAIILIVFVVVYGFERLSGWLRAQLG